MKVILGKAAASSKHEIYPKGEIHAVLMFIKSDNHDKAKKIAKIEMQDRDWRKLKMSRIGAVNIDSFDSEDKNIKNAFNSAIEIGFGLSVYPEVEKNLNL